MYYSRQCENLEAIYSKSTGLFPEINLYQSEMISGL
ncbi:hypothetical protein T4C_11887 [Trichinella pseudospiralis]|uniref:Uncharacterized protein n=1 Tax=Trichinella pseudospiralis TaxID=6337 RepID=A0A0V1GJ62_TRIPS|nr:hypothetical protein T4C_11887 [Trichinella pseudospiralis]